MTGTESTFLRPLSLTEALTNIPGRSFSPGFFTVAWRRTLRVFSSMRGSTVVTRPFIVVPGKASEVMLNWQPGPERRELLLRDAEIDEDRVEGL